VRPYTEDEIREIILNPYYSVNLKDVLFTDNDPKIAKEDWVLKNANLMSEIGIKTWLEKLLVILSEETQVAEANSIMNPALAIAIAKTYKGVHEPIVSRSMWVEANQKSIEDSGSESWLSRFLDTLQSRSDTEVE
jgi:hypothetical protein